MIDVAIPMKPQNYDEMMTGGSLIIHITVNIRAACNYTNRFWLYAEYEMYIVGSVLMQLRVRIIRSK